MKMKRGFASAVFASLVVLSLVFFASALLMKNSGFQNAQLQARLVSERFEDAGDFLNSTLNDAIFDSAYSAGCDFTADFCISFSTKYANYLQAASVLNDSRASVSFHSESGCSSVSSASFAVVESGVLSANSSSFFFKTAKLGLSKTVLITRQMGAGGGVEVSLEVVGEKSFGWVSCS
ncbi:MAG: hypothetical protein V1717_01360 [Candidatus Micrarchaeota archaeon]